MVQIEEGVTFEGEPGKLTVENVQYWCRHTKELKNTQVNKALQFVRFNCLHYIGNNRFVCLPLNTEKEWSFKLDDAKMCISKKPFDTDYNRSEYIISRLPGGTFECNCQGWQSKARRGEAIKDGANCSHVLALFYAFKLKKFK